MKKVREITRYNLYLKKSIIGIYGKKISSGVLIRERVNVIQLKEALIKGEDLIEGHGISTFVKPNNILVEEVKKTYRKLTVKELGQLKQLTSAEYREIHGGDKNKLECNISTEENKIRKQICRSCDYKISKDGCKQSKNKFMRTICFVNQNKFRLLKMNKRYKEIKKREV